MQHSSSSPGFEICNDTELYQLCRRAGIHVIPGLDRRDYIDYLLGNKVSPWTEEHHNIDQWRHGLTNFVFDYWSVLQPQLTCPIRSKDPTSCWGCLDLQVVSCVAQGRQEGYEHLISAHRRSKK